MWNRPNSETIDGRTAAALVRDHLPPGWTVALCSTDGGTFLTLEAPDGRTASLEVIVRKLVAPRDVSELLRQARERGAQRLLIAPFLSPRARDLLGTGEMSYADGTGNLRVVVDSPAVFLSAQGLDRDPVRRPRALRSLKGAAAGRVVRALCDFMPPYGVRSLAQAAEIPLGTASRVISFLEEEALLTRDDRKRIVAVDWAALLRRWTTDYGVVGSNIQTSFIEPRGLDALPAKLSRLSRYAVTGTFVATGIAAARLAMIYVDDAAAAAETLEIVPTEAGANVWLLEPFDGVVFERTRELLLPGQASPIVAVAKSQAAADLLTSPGRSPQEADALLERMKDTEDAWRIRP